MGKGERKLLEQATQLALINANITKEELQFFIGGDLLNQIISSSFSARKLGAPYLGIFGACSTSMESLALASLIVDSGGVIMSSPVRSAITAQWRSSSATRPSMAPRNLLMHSTP